jgi:hypothetical protein
MRADMGKVLVERPRKGGVRRAKKGYRKRAAKDLAADGGPVREGMKARSGGTKFFNEHLGPLRRFLDANVGRPWDKVHAEIREYVDPGNMVQKHVLTHLFEYVVTEVEEIDGEPYDARPRRLFLVGERRSLRTSYSPQWYVCPRTGLLRKSKFARWRYSARKPPLPPRRVKVSSTEVCLELDGRWELVALAPLPDAMAEQRRFDVVLGRNVGADAAGEAVQLYGARAYATERRVLSRAEQKRLPIPIDWVK